jgi:hypothetical protein
MDSIKEGQGQFAASRIEAGNENKVIPFSRSGHVKRKTA